jgi:hypothetical protein
MGDKIIYGSRLAHRYRTELMMEHFDLPYEEVKDPIKNLKMLANIADINTRIYEEVMFCEPGSYIKNFK